MRKYPKSVLVRLREEDFAWLEGVRGREDRGEFVRRLVELAREGAVTLTADRLIEERA